MGAKKQENEMVAAFGSAAEAVKGLANALGQLPADKFPEINEEQNIIPSMEAVETEQPVGAFEIAPGMTVEQIKSEFFNDDALQEQPETVYRLDSSGHRYYYTFDEDGEPRFYVSVTTLIKQTLPTAPSLIKWIADTGYEESQRYAAERASYGTFMHSQIAELIINRKYDLNKLRERLVQYIETEQLPSDFINYTDDFKKDLLAFAQFMKDVELKPLAIELVLTNPEDGYAGAIDLAAEITIEEKGFFGEVYKTGANAGQPKETKQKRRIRAIIDFKSGRKGFFPEHEVQLHAYMKMWNMHFEAYPIEKVFNWSPKDWRGKVPTYNFKDQTESKNAQKLPFLVELAKIEDEKRDNTIISCSGIIDVDCGLESNIMELSLAEVVKKRKFIEPEMPEQKKSVAVENSEQNPKSETNQAQVVSPEVVISCEHFINAINSDNENYSLYRASDIAWVNGATLVEEGLNLDQHRWYSIATNIYKCSDGYVKVTGAYQSFSESQTWEDINVHSEAELLQGNELKAFQLRQQAAELEKTPEAKEEKTENEAENKPAVAKTIRKRTITTKETKKPENEPKKAKTVKKAPEKEQKTEKKLSKKDLLNNAIDI